MEPTTPSALVCRVCNKRLDDSTEPTTPIDRSKLSGRALLASAPPPGPSIARVSVVDINMPFASMVGFMVKWAIAAIPALVILVMIAVLAGAAMTGLVAALAVMPTPVRPVPERVTEAERAAVDEAAWRERLRTIITAAGRSCAIVTDTANRPAATDNYWGVRCTAGQAFVVRLRTGAAPLVVACGGVTSANAALAACIP